MSEAKIEVVVTLGDGVQRRNFVTLTDFHGVWPSYELCRKAMDLLKLQMEELHPEHMQVYESTMRKAAKDFPGMAAEIEEGLKSHAENVEAGRKMWQ